MGRRASVAHLRFCRLRVKTIARALSVQQPPARRGRCTAAVEIREFRRVVNRLNVSRFFRQAGRRLLGFDSWVSASVFDSGQSARRRYANFSTFMDRFHVSGPLRWFVELSCEGLTLGLGAAIVALTLALPAFQETSDDWLKKQDLAITFLDRYGTEIGRRGIRHDDSVPFEQIPDYLVKALLATEDRRFYEHFGIDIIGTARALSVNARSTNVRQGGSSITQQLAKNLFLTSERTIERKIKEAFLALWLESHLSKKEILRLYLDRAYMGGGNFGAQAAAEFYFGKNIRDINLSEAAMMAGLFKAPTKYAPHVNLPAARARANDVLNNLIDAGFMTEGQVYAARKNPATPVDRRQDSSPDWYLDWAYQEVKAMVDAGKLGPERVLTVRAAIDVNLQRHAEAVIEGHLRESGPQYHARQSAAVIMEPNGAVRAIVGGRDYGASQFNRATEALRQPGSSFKPFVYLTALMTNKFTPKTIVVDSPVCIGNWCPHNFGGSFAGSLPLANAMARSLNTVAIKLSIAIGDGNPKLGRAKIVETARKMGLTTPWEDSLSMPIGDRVITVMEMAGAYCAFANGGKRVTPYAAVEIRNSKGELVYKHDRDVPPPEQVIPQNYITDINFMLNKVVEEGTARRAILPYTKVGGKTGTTNAFRDAWFDGFTGNFVGSVWYGNDDNSPMENMTGGSLPAQTWHDIMDYAHQGVEIKPFFAAPPMAAPGVNPAVAFAPLPGAAAKVQELGAVPQRPAQLSRQSAEVIGGIEQLFKKVEGKRAAAGEPVSMAAGGSANVMGTPGRVQ